MTTDSIQAVCRRALGAILFVVAVVIGDRTGAGHALAGDPSTDERPMPSYRRIMVPAEAPAAWPVAGETYLPIEAREFDAWIAAASRPVAVAQISSAEYFARLEGRRLVDGRGSWSVELSGGRSAALSLTDTTLLIDHAHWRNDRAEQGDAARLGLWTDRGAGSYALEVTQSGTLDFAWHTPGGVERGGRLEIPLRLPTATMTRLTLDLPDGMHPVMDGCVVLDSSPTTTAGSQRRWEITVSGSSSGRLRVEPSQGSQFVAPTAFSVRDEIHYQVSGQGLDLRATLHIDRLGKPVRELSVTVPGMLQLVSGTVNGRTVRWRMTTDPQTTAARATLALPEIPLDDELVVQLHAWGTPVTDQSWTLPKLRVDGGSWSSGSVRIAVDEPFELCELESTDCIQTGIQTVTMSNDERQAAPLRDAAKRITTDGDRRATTAGRVHSFELHTLQPYSPDARITLIVGHRPAKCNVQVSTTLKIGIPDVQGSVVSKINVRRGNLFAASAELQPSWSINSVETIPREALGEWFIERRDGHRLLEVQFTQAVAPTRPVTVMLTAVRRGGQAKLFEPVELDSLAVLRWEDVTVERNLLQLTTVEPYELVPLDVLPAVAASDLPDDVQPQLDSPAEGIWFDLQAATSASESLPQRRVRLSPTRGTYDADVRLDAEVQGRWLRSTYRVTCRPRRSGIDELLVYFSNLPTNPPRWVNLKTGEPLSAERVPSTDPRISGVPSEGELWRLPLGRTYLDAVALIATIRVPLADRRAIPIISLPEATQSRGRIAVGSTALAPPSIESEGLVPVPLSNAEPTQESMAAYEYHPVVFYGVGTSPKLWLAPSANASASAPLLATSAQLESCYSASGRGIHRATYHLENLGAANVELAMSAGTEFGSASLDDMPLLRSTVDPPSEPRVLLGLPRSSASGVLTVDFQSQSRPLSGGIELSSPLPKSNITILSGGWSIWLPAEFAVDGTDPARDKAARLVHASTPRLDWRQRLFGPLARPADEPPFNPLRIDDWLALLPGTTSPQAARADAAVRSGQGPSRAPVGVAFDDHDEPIAATGETAEVVQLAAYSSTETGLLLPTADSPRTLAVPRGWHSYEAGFGAHGPLPIKLLHPPMSAAWSLAMILACLSGLTLYQPRATQFVVILAAVVVLSLLLPMPYAPLATGAFLGVLLAPLCRWIIRSNTGNQHGKSTSQQKLGSTTVLSTPLLLLSATFLTFAMTAAAAAQDAAVNQQIETDARVDDVAAAAATIYRVLVPVDDAGEPVGSKYFVSKRFARLLLQSAQERGRGHGSWLLLGMGVDGDLDTDPIGNEKRSASSGDWTISLDIESLARDAMIELPLVRSQAKWPATASLDGIPTAIEWNDTGIGCRLQIREPGRYQLVVQFEPNKFLIAGRQQVELNLPPLPGATLRIGGLQPRAALTLNGAPLEPQGSKSAAEWVGELDRSGHVLLDWTDSSDGAVRGAVQGLDELTWLQIEPNGALLDVKYVPVRRSIADGAGPWPNSIVLRVEHNCELLTDVGQGATCDVEPLADGGRAITIPIESTTPNDSRRDVHLRFRVRDAVPLGRFRVPRVELVSLPVNQRWLAVTADPALDCVPLGDVVIARESVDNFATAWGIAAGASLLQFVLTHEEPELPWSLSVRPHATVTEHTEQLLVAAGQEQFQLLYQADVTPQGPHQFGWSLSVPEDLAIERISAIDADAPVPLRWVRVTADRVNVFFAAKTVGPYELTLAGAVPVTDFGVHRIPHIVARNTPLVPQTVMLYRDERVVASAVLPRAMGIPETVATRLPPADWKARFVGNYTVGPLAADELHVDLQPNRIRLDGRTLTSLENDGGTWFATYAAQLHVEQGQLNSLEFRVPSSWQGPFETHPETASAKISATSGDFATLSVEFTNPFEPGDRVEFELRSPLALGANQNVAVPQIAPRMDGRWQSFASVPAEIDDAPLVWSRSGVEPAALPAGLPKLSASSGMSETYRVTAEPFRVALRSTETVAAASTIRLAEMRTLVGPTGGQSMVTRFTIVPHGLSECVLELPTDQQLVGATLDGHSAVMRPLDGRRYWVQLGPPHLPQTLDVVARTIESASVDLRQLHLRRPTLKQLDQPMPVELSLWSLCRPELAAQELVIGGASLTAGEQSTLRLERLVSISEAATRDVMDAPVADGFHWFTSWSETLDAAEHAARTEQRRSTRLEQSSPEVTPIEDPSQQALERCRVWRAQAEELFATTGAAAGKAQQVAVRGKTKFAFTTPPGCVWTHYVTAGSMHDHGLTNNESNGSELHIELVLEEWTPLATRIITVGCVVVLAVAAGWFANQPAAIEMFARWPHAVAVLIGLAIWAWLRPSWLGLAIAVVSLSLLLRAMLVHREIDQRITISEQ